MATKGVIGQEFLGFLFPGLGKAWSSALEARHMPWVSVTLSLGLVCMFALPLCFLMAWVWMYTRNLTFSYGVAQAMGLTAGPYLAWLAAVYCILHCLLRRKRTESPAVLLNSASRFWVPYLLAWPLAIGWPFMMMLVWFLAFGGPRAGILGYYLFSGVPLLVGACGITLLLLGISRFFDSALVRRG